MSPELVELRNYIDKLELYIWVLSGLYVIAALATAYLVFSKKEGDE